MENSLLIFLLSTLIQSCFPERILFFLPLSSTSMVNIFEPLGIALANRGHSLTIVSSVKFSIQESNTNVTQFIPASPSELFSDYPEPFEIRRENKLYSYPMEFQLKYCEILYESNTFLEALSDDFDLVLFNIFYHDCFAGLFHQIGSPIIQVASLPVPSPVTELFGTYLPSSFVPIMILGDIDAKLSFAQRTKNFLLNTYYSVMLDCFTRPPLETFYRRRLGLDVPSIKEIYKKHTSLVFMNAHFSLTSARPNLPNIVDIGGIHCRPGKPLPKDLETFVDGSEGFILFSLGSIVKSTNMPENVRLAFVNTFATLKERVIWKWEGDEGLDNLPDNVKLVKWLPQQDLLAHPKLKLFITHGGLLSTEEAAYHGVPVLGMPVYIDQDANMRQAEILGFGVKGEILDLTEENLTALVRRILDDPTYLARAKEISEIFKDQPETPLERAVYWSEYVMRHNGADHMKSSAMDLNFIEYFCMDVILFLILVACVLVYMIYLTVKLCIVIFVGLCKKRSSTTGRAVDEKKKRN